MFPRLLLILSAMVLMAPPAQAAGSSSERYQESYALEAAYSYQRALEKLEGITPTGADAWLLPLRKGWLLYLLGRYEESVLAYDQAAKAALPGSLEATLGRSLPLMALKRWAEAERDCRAVLKASPGSYTAQSRLAYVLYNSGKYAEAGTEYAALVTAWPSDVEMRAGLGWALLKQGKTAEAKAAFELVLYLVPDHSSAREGVALVR